LASFRYFAWRLFAWRYFVFSLSVTEYLLL
jgi:hypothetical protein